MPVAWLSATVLVDTVTKPPVLYTPPPTTAMLPDTVLAETVVPVPNT